MLVFYLYYYLKYSTSSVKVNDKSTTIESNILIPKYDKRNIERGVAIILYLNLFSAMTCYW